ncbi:MAG: hypothetical protein QXG17_06420 [Sulfolobales archaeon]
MSVPVELLKVLGNRFVAAKRTIIREYVRYKMYLQEQYNEIWGDKEAGEAVDLFIIVRG